MATIDVFIRQQIVVNQDIHLIDMTWRSKLFQLQKMLKSMGEKSFLLSMNSKKLFCWISVRNFSDGTTITEKFR